MKTSRRYRLLCPIARGLDQIGDKWALLILRDLHAGPARFSDLQTGLRGIAPNLLTERLRELESSGLIVRRTTTLNVAVYELTELGESSGPLLFALSNFGSQFQPEGEVTTPGNLRAIAVTMKVALNATIDQTDEFRIELRVDGECFDVQVAKGEASVLYGQSEKPSAVISTTYRPLIEVGDGLMSVSEFISEHLEIVDGSHELAGRFLKLVAAGVNGHRVVE